MTLDQFYRAAGGTAAEAAPRLGGADATRRFLRLFPLDDSFPQLSEALGRGDVQTAFRAAHTLKGVAANLGLERLRALASDMTECLRRGDLSGAQARLAETEAAYRRVLAALEELEWAYSPKIDAMTPLKFVQDDA